MAITGVHAVLYTHEAEADRAWLTDVLGLKSVDAGGGWLIFALPPAELAVHPASSEGGEVELYLMCDDIETFTVNQFDRQGGTRIGTGHGYCVLGVNPFSTCTTVLKDTRGNRLVMEWDNDATRTTNKFAIIGGTGRYRTSRGEGTLSVQNGDATTYSMKLTIIG